MSIENKPEDKKAEDIREDIDALFSGEELSEEFKTQAKAIFEAAVLSKVEEQRAELEESLVAELEEQHKVFTESLVNKVDEYLEYVVAEWMEDNKVAIESGIKAEIAEDFMVGLKNLFTENYVDLPDDQVGMVEQYAGKVTSLEEELDKAVTERSSLIEQLNSYKKQQLVDKVSEGLSEVQFAKLKSLAENIDFISEEDYKEKLNLTKRKYFESSKGADTPATSVSQSLDSEEVLDESYSPVMGRYIDNISRIVKK